jgi:cell wall-associated NlpC family hydrolase
MRSLSSRGFDAEAASNIVGRLATVTRDKAQILGGRERGNRVLSVVPNGQLLAICGENSTQYGVMMIDHTVGYIAKSDVQLMEYQVVQDPPADGGDPNVTALENGLVATARSYAGVPYLWGGESSDGIDCSGLMQTVFAANGINLPRVSGDQAGVGYDVPLNDPSQWKPGDRLYFACHHPRIDHTGLYIGGGLFIHAHGSHGHQVGYDSIDNVYYRSHLVAVRRSTELVARSGAASEETAVSTNMPQAPAAGTDTVQVVRATSSTLQTVSSAQTPNASAQTTSTAAQTVISGGDPEANQQ